MRWASRDRFAVNKANPPDQTLGPVVVVVLIAIVVLINACAWLLRRAGERVAG